MIFYVVSFEFIKSLKEYATRQTQKMWNILEFSWPFVFNCHKNGAILDEKKLRLCACAFKRYALGVISVNY